MVTISVKVIVFIIKDTTRPLKFQRRSEMWHEQKLRSWHPEAYLLT